MANGRILAPMYDINDYAHMIADKTRMDAYAIALKQAIQPGDIVLDIGTATGIHALLACKFGAKHVYAIEPNDGIHLAQKLAQENGYADRITFYQDISIEVTLPQKADVIVSDLRGTLPLFGEHIPTLVDARNRHLKTGGTLIPQEDKLWVALIELPLLYNRLVAPWNDPYGLKMETAKQEALHSWGADGTDLIKPRHLLTKALNWATLDYTTITNPHVVAKNLTLTPTRAGKAHGLFIWFDACLMDDVTFSNGADAAQFATVYGRSFFPLPQPTPITLDTQIQLSLYANLVDGIYEWQWPTQITPPDDTPTL